MPSLNGLYKELDKEGFTLLLINIGEEPERVQQAVTARGYVAPVLVDADGRLMDAYGVRATPTAFVIGRDGTLRGRAVGPRSWASPAGRALLQALLRESPAGR